MTTKYFYCWASGLAQFGKKVPDGAIEIAKTRNYTIKWKNKLAIKCRLSKDGKKLLIPGIPEADSQDEKLEALLRFKKWIKGGKPQRLIK